MSTKEKQRKWEARCWQETYHTPALVPYIHLQAKQNLNNQKEEHAQ